MAKNARRASREEIWVSLFDFPLGEVHEMMTLASDAPGSLFGEFQRFTMPTATSKKLAVATLFSVVLCFVLQFLVSPQSQFVLFATLGGSCSRRVSCNVGTAGGVRSAVGLDCDSLCGDCSLVRCTSSLVRASEVKPHTGVFRIARHLVCMFPTSFKHRKQSEKSVRRFVGGHACFS